jgi:hypothetical protein
MGKRMKKFWHNNGLTIVLLACFLAFWGGQTVVGWHVYNDEQQQHREKTVSLPAYVGTGHWMEATFENWESEFLQMAAYVVLGTALFQKGSAESKDPDKAEDVDKEPDPNKPDAPGPVKKGGLALTLYRHSLSLAFAALFLLSFALHAIGGAREYSSEQIQFGQQPVSTWEFLGTSEFWFQSLQNWQSEFLAVVSIVVLSIWLRQKGSPESKPVDAPHSQTGSG